MYSKVKKRIWIVAAAFILVAATLVIFDMNTHFLFLRDAESRKIYARFPLSDGDTFSVTFVHSVNQSPVTDYYKIGANNELVLYATKFHAFGAGMPESWPPNAQVQTSPDGIYATNLQITLPNVTYIVGTVSDHILTIGDKTISLRDLCGKNAEVLFTLT